MKLTRLYAFEVFPQKHMDNIERPSGGKMTINADIRNALNQLVSDIRLESEAPIAFHVEDPKAKKLTNEVRDKLLQFCFGKTLTPAKVAGELAMKLASVMDKRSSPFLLLFSGFEGKKSSRVVIWAFPKDKVFKFTATRDGANVEVIPDVFSVSSKIRKAALFDGQNKADSFWEGRMLDLQSGTTELWVEHFLDCRLSVSGSFGTQRLAGYLGDLYKKSDGHATREQIFNAIVAVRTAPVRRMSFLKFAKDYLSGETKNEFLAIVLSEERSMTFDFDRAVFENKLGFRVFKMEDDVFVSAPLGVIGTSVKITNEQLKYEGEINEEYLKATNARR